MVPKGTRRMWRSPPISHQPKERGWYWRTRERKRVHRCPLDEIRRFLMHMGPTCRQEGLFDWKTCSQDDSTCGDNSWSDPLGLPCRDWTKVWQNRLFKGIFRMVVFVAYWFQSSIWAYTRWQTLFCRSANGAFLLTRWVGIKCRESGTTLLWARLQIVAVPLSFCLTNLFVHSISLDGSCVNLFGSLRRRSTIWTPGPCHLPVAQSRRWNAWALWAAQCATISWLLSVLSWPYRISNYISYGFTKANWISAHSCSNRGHGVSNWSSHYGRVGSSGTWACWSC